MLGSSGKKILLSTHITLVAVWIGALIAILLLLLCKYSAFNAVQFAALDKSIFFNII